MSEVLKAVLCAVGAGVITVTIGAFIYGIVERFGGDVVIGVGMYILSLSIYRLLRTLTAEVNKTE